LVRRLVRLGSALGSSRTAAGRRRYRVLRQLKSAVLLAPRRPFPPSEPWQFVQSEAELPPGAPGARARGGHDRRRDRALAADAAAANEIATTFSQPKMLVAAFAGGSFACWALIKLAAPPLVPPSLVSMVGSIVIGYTATRGDARGDFVRCAAGLLVQQLGVVLEVWGELELTDKTLRAFRLGASHLRSFDEKYQVGVGASRMEFVRLLSVRFSEFPTSAFRVPHWSELP
jgi:hypothetical protein